MRQELLTDFAKNTALSTGVGLGVGALGKIGMWAAKGGNPIKSIKNVVSNIKRKGERKWNEIRGPSRRAKIDKDIAAHNKDKFGEGQVVSEFWPAVAAGVGAGLGMWGIEQSAKPKEEQTWHKLWKRFGPKKKVKDPKPQEMTDSVDPQPWWRDMDSTLQEMKAEIMETPKKK